MRSGCFSSSATESCSNLPTPTFVPRLTGFTRINDEKPITLNEQSSTAIDVVAASAHAQYADEQSRWSWSGARTTAATMLKLAQRILVHIMYLLLATLPVLLWLHALLATEPFPRWINYSLPRARLLNISTFGLALVWSLVILFSAVRVIFDKDMWWTLRRVRNWIAIPLSIGLIVAAATSPLTIIYLVKERELTYQCRDAWMVAIITNDTATMWLDDAPMYSYRIFMPHPEIATFSQVDFRPNALGVPTIRRLEYNTTSGGITGSCLAGLGPAENVVLAGNTTGCLDVSGNYATTPVVAFNISVAGKHHSQSNAVDLTWSFDDAPFLDLRDATQPDVVFLQTDLHSCPKMAVCLPGPPHSTLGPEVLAPLGWLTLQAHRWSAKCSRPFKRSPIGLTAYNW